MEEEKYESPYCPVCDGCGEDGCCSAMFCKQHPDGHYCKTYLNELKFAYLMFNDIYDLIPNDEETQRKLDELYSKNWDKIFMK